MKKKTPSILAFLVGAAICLLFNACVPVSTAGKTQPDPLAPPASTAGQKTKTPEAGQLPVRFQTPAYMLEEPSSQNISATNAEGITIPIGADISSNSGPVTLRDIMKQLAALQGMNISWASDVDQFAMVDVDIRAEDDFFKAIDNLLRQKDYFHEVQGNSIVVKYRETKKFHVAMPFLKSAYKTSVGGDVLGAGGVAGQSNSSALMGTIKLESDDNKFDIWENIRKNLDQLLEIWEETVSVPPAPTPAGGATPPTAPPAPTTTTKRNVQAGKGYYTIDKPIGLITVTAPRPLVEKINVYFDNLKKELYRQVAIEAKIVEVIVDDTEKKGIDWTSLLDLSVNMEMFGPNGIIYQQRNRPTTLTATTSELGSDLTNTLTDGVLTSTLTDTNNSSSTSTSSNQSKALDRVVSKLSLPGNPFNILISALETQGPTNILANPKISVMNGQPALISIGENVRFIEKVETTVEEGVVSTSVTTNSVMSGLGMSVIATIMENDEIILSITPVTSSLRRMDERSFGVGGLLVQLPTVNVREMNSLVRVKSGAMLMIGGLIDNVETDNIKKVPILGDIPGLTRLFSHSTKSTKKKELVILLQPKIL